MAKSVLIPLGLTVVASAANTGIQKKKILRHNTNNIKWWNGRHYKNS